VYCIIDVVSIKVSQHHDLQRDNTSLSTAVSLALDAPRAGVLLVAFVTTIKAAFADALRALGRSFPTALCAPIIWRFVSIWALRHSVAKFAARPAFLVCLYASFSCAVVSNGWMHALMK